MHGVYVQVYSIALNNDVSQMLWCYAMIGKWI